MPSIVSMRHVLAGLGALCLLLLGFTSQAQTSPVYGNEWINYNQQYYKIKVLNTGMHRLTYNDLVAAGISNVNPQKFQLFRRGREVAIYVNGQADGALNAGDYIDFFGQKNDGELDTELYSSPVNQIHKYYSLYQDTAAYFLTWGTANGKRMVEKTSQTSGLTAEPRHYAERLKLITTNFFPGYQVSTIQGALGDMSEGYMSNYFGGTKNDTISNLPNADVAGRNPIVEVGVVSAYFNPSYVRFLVVPPSGPERLLTNATTSSTGRIKIMPFNYKIPKFQILPSDINPNGTLTIKVDDSITNPVNLIRISHYKVTYPRTNNLNNSDRIIFTDSLKTTASYYLFDNAPVNAVAFDVTDPYNVSRTQGVANGSQIGFVFDPSAQRRKILIAKGETTRVPIAVKSVSFQHITNPSAFNYIIITHGSLRTPIAGTQVTDPPADYAAYRATPAGGGYSPLVTDINDLYNQFSFGEKSSISISNFMKWLIANGNPKYLFLMGRGVERDQHDASSPVGDIRTRPEYYKAQGLGEDLIPTYGFPASDILFTADWKNNSFVPRVPTGRLSVSSGQEIINYLNKIKQHDQLANEEWRKNFLHLGGGDPDEAPTFRNYLNNYKNKVEGPLLGARVKSIFRQGAIGGGSTFINIKSDLNAGLSFITFFGHSSSTISDLDVGYVSDPINGYNNQQKYPMILMNGCNSGNSFLLKGTNGRYSFGEDWIATPDKGAILFLAATGQEVPFALNNYSSNFYNVAFTDQNFYGQPVGDIQKETIRRAISASPNNWEYRAVVTEMVLQGDPAVRLYAPDKPDYTFQTNGARLVSNPRGETVTASSEKFDIEINVKNLGKALDDSLRIAVRRTLPDGRVILYPARNFKPVYNDAQLFFPIDNKNVSSFGSNKFEIILDYGDSIPEFNESNNTFILNQYLSVNGVIALLPKEFDIVSTSTVKLIGQPASLLSPSRDYYFELDTTATFISAAKKSTVVQKGGSAPSWTTTLLPNVSPNDSVVYFWRFRFNTFAANEDTIWATSSFRYIPNSPSGWSQSHYAQFDRNEKNQVEIDPVSKRLEFAKITKLLTLKTAGGGIQFNTNHGIEQNNVSMIGFNCSNGATPQIIIAVFNNKTLDPIRNIQAAPAPSGKCGLAQAIYYFRLDTSPQIDELANFINRIPDGSYVALLSENNVPFSTFTATQKAAFQKLGSTLINTLNSGEPFALVGVKGATAAQARLVDEKTYDATSSTIPQMQNIELNATITGRGTQGTLTSTRIGPATQWTTLHHTVKTNGKDDYTLDLYAFDSTGTRTLLVPDIASQTYSLAAINAKSYPYLQLQLSLADTADHSAPQLEQWMVVYQGVPEGMMRPDLVGIEKYNVDKDAANGKVNLRFAFQNISELPFSDSLTVVRSVVGTSLQDTIKVKKLLANDSVYFNYSFNTGGLKGLNIVRVEVNPGILPEQYYFNNFLEVPFTLPNADLHPTLDVAFDGRRIMDGDIVAPSPKIAINLKDEDKYDFIKDPNKLEVFLKRPGALTYERINLEDPNLVTLPNMNDANRDKREFSIVYHPQNLPDSPDGEDYQLRVQGSDNSGNQAGFEPYTISFKVINESAITHFYPYPNPFSSNTRFVFTLTGNPENMPKNLKIQIMTLTGKVVREIQKEELGNFAVGNNMSEPWDGTDEFGDKLANGVYLYRVVMDKAPLEEMKHRKTAADKSFKKEYGKLYILR